MQKKQFQVILSVLIMLILACSQEHTNNNNQNNPIDSIDSPTNNTEKSIQIIKTKYSNKGVLIGDNIVLYDDQLQPIKNISYQNEKIVDIIGKTDKRINLLNDNDICNNFYFVEIKLNEVQGWVNGKYVFEFKDTEQDSLNISGANSYSFITTKNFGIGSMNDIGLTGCGEFYPIVLHDMRNESYNLIEFKNTIEIGVNEFKYFCLKNDEGGTDLIKSISIADTIILEFERQMQTAKAKYKLKVIKNTGNKFEGKAFDYEIKSDY